MSDQATTPETSAPAEDTSVDTTSAPAQENAAKDAAAPEAPKTEAKPDKDSMAKFRNADGSLNAERLAKSYENLEKRFGSKPNIPAASAEEYEWQAPENGVELDDEGLAAFKTEALEQGFTTKQYQFLMNRYNDVVVGIRDAGPTADKAEKVLKAEWGNAYAQQLKNASTGFDVFAPSDANRDDPVWNHPAVLKLLARIGSEVTEDSIEPKGNAAGGGGESVQAQIDALRGSADYWKPENQAKVLKLYEKLSK
jgi:hypothetical protein